MQAENTNKNPDNIKAIVGQKASKDIRSEFEGYVRDFAFKKKDQVMHFTDLLYQIEQRHIDKITDTRIRRVIEVLRDLNFCNASEKLDTIFRNGLKDIKAMVNAVLESGGDKPNAEQLEWAEDIVATYSHLHNKASTIMMCADLNEWPAAEWIYSAKSLAR